MPRPQGTVLHPPFPEALLLSHGIVVGMVKRRGRKLTSLSSACSEALYLQYAGGRQTSSAIIHKISGALLEV